MILYSILVMGLLGTAALAAAGTIYCCNVMIKRNVALVEWLCKNGQ